MRQSSLEPPIPASTLLVRLRPLVVIGPLLLIVYFTAYAVLFVPYIGFDIAWRPDSIATVWKFGFREDPPAQRYLQPDDVILAIDGEPVRMIDWRPLFPELKPSYEFTVERNSQVLAFDVPVAGPSARIVLARMGSGLVAFATWFLGSLVLMFAGARNRAAWRAGFVLIGLAVSLAAAQADEVNTPGAGIVDNALIPIMAVGFTEIAFLPRSGPRKPYERAAFRALYVGALVLSLAGLFETFFLLPRRDSFEINTGVSLNAVRLLMLAGGLIANPLIVLVRYLSTRRSYVRRQLLIILSFTAIAVLPLIVFSVIPVMVFGFDSPIVPYELTIPLLILVPAAYGFVIYRHQYLGLDLFATNTLTLLILGLILTVLYSAGFYFLGNLPNLAALEPMPSVAFMLLALGLVPRIGRPSRHAVQTLLYGSGVSYQDAADKFMSALSADPQISTLRKVFRNLADLLEVRRAVLMLSDYQDRLIELDCLRVQEENTRFRVEDLEDLPPGPTLRSEPGSEETLPRLFTVYPWAAVIVPLRTRGRLIGMLVMGPRAPDEFFNAQHIAFLRQIAEAMAVAAEAIRLFEASREISRELLRVRDAERRQISAQIHDEPLQRISLVANTLDELLLTPEIASAEICGELRAQKEHLRQIARQLREICIGLRPPVLEQGIQWAIKQVIYNFRQQNEIRVELEVDIPGEMVIVDEITTVIYYVLVEALNNISKHAQASTAWVYLGQKDGQVQLSVRDDGDGAAFGSLSLSDLIRERQIGIVGMYEWASMVQGKLTISQPDEGGTAIVLDVPLEVKSSVGQV